jgi:flagellar FliL protein
MEQEIQNTETQSLDIPEIKKGGINMKVILFGLPLFIVQLIVVYFVTANILLNKVEGNSAHQQTEGQAAAQPADTNVKKAESQKSELGKYIYSVDDMIVNPAGTNGDQLLLTSIAFDLATPESEKEIKEKEIVVKDMIISVLSSKSITQLNNTAYKDTLRTEISKKLQTNMPQVKVNKVYFSKYIIN